MHVFGSLIDRVRPSNRQNFERADQFSSEPLVDRDKELLLPVGVRNVEVGSGHSGDAWIINNAESIDGALRTRLGVHNYDLGILGGASDLADILHPLIALPAELLPNESR